MSGASSLGDFDDLGLDDEPKEEQQPRPKIGTFQPPTITSKHMGQRSLDVLHSGPLRAQVRHLHQASELVQREASEEKDEEEDISSSRKHIPMKLSKQNIKLLKGSVMGKPPPSGFRHSSKMILKRQNNREIEEEQHNEIDLTPQKDRRDLAQPESPEDRYKTSRSSMRVKAPLERRKSRIEEEYNK